MYRDYFRIDEKPFSITPDPRYLFLTQGHEEAIAHLLYGVNEGGGFVLLTGEVGTGKTSVCRCVLEQVDEHVRCALILNPRLNEIELVAAICDELGVAYPKGTNSLKILVDELNKHLLMLHAMGQHAVVMLDEAQDLDTGVLEQVRLLTNLETSKQKLLQIVLIGQPELNEVLSRREIRQLAQRITARYHLKPLKAHETRDYINHRLMVAGLSPNIFTPKAVQLVHRRARGVPRLINIICDRSMLGAYAQESMVIDRPIVKRAAAEVLGKRRLPRILTPEGWRWSTPLAAGAAAVVLAVLAFQAIPFESWLENYARPAVVEFEGDSDDVQAPDEVDIAIPDPAASTQVAVRVPDDSATVNTQTGPAVSEVEAIQGDEPAVTTERAASATVAISDTQPAIADGQSSSQSPIAEPGASADTEGPAAAIEMPQDAGDLGQTAAVEPEPDIIEGDIGDVVVGSILSSRLVSGAVEDDLLDATEIPVENNQVDELDVSSVETQSDNLVSEATQVALARSLPDPADLDDAGDGAGEKALYQTPIDDPWVAKPQGRIGQPNPGNGLAPLLGTLDSQRSRDQALSGLFKQWDLDFDPSRYEGGLEGLNGLPSFCGDLPKEGLACLRGKRAWRGLESYDRPALIELLAPNGDGVYAAVVELRGDYVTLDLDGREIVASRDEIEELWSGEYLLFWRAPATFRRLLVEGAEGPDVVWLRQTLTKILDRDVGQANQASFDALLKEAVIEFQASHYLVQDGIVGPQTIIHMTNKMGDVPVPRLSNDRS